VRAAEPLLQLPLLGHVARDAEHADDATIVVTQRAAREQQRATPPVDHDVLLRGLALAARAHACVCFARAGGLVGGEQACRRGRRSRPRAGQQARRARVDEHVAPLQVLRHDGVARALDDLLQQIAAAAQRVLHLLGVGDVLRQRHPATIAPCPSRTGPARTSSQRSR